MTGKVFCSLVSLLEFSEFFEKGLAQGKSSVHTFLLNLSFNTLKNFLNLSVVERQRHRDLDIISMNIIISL